MSNDYIKGYNDAIEKICEWYIKNCDLPLNYIEWEEYVDAALNKLRHDVKLSIETQTEL